MLSNLTRLEHIVGDRVYHFLCDANSPIAEVKDAICQFMGFVANVERASKEQTDLKAKEDAAAAAAKAKEDADAAAFIDAAVADHLSDFHKGAPNFSPKNEDAS